MINKALIKAFEQAKRAALANANNAAKEIGKLPTEYRQFMHDSLKSAKAGKLNIEQFKAKVAEIQNGNND